MRLAPVWMACVCALLGGGGCGRRSAEADPLLVSAAVSLSTVLEELGARYTRETGARVRFNLAGSNVLARQIVEGAAVDVFVSADEAQMRVVEDAGLIAAGTKVVLLTNQLAVVVRPGWTRALKGLTDLGAGDMRRVAIGSSAPGCGPCCSRVSCRA